MKWYQTEETQRDLRIKGEMESWKLNFYWSFRIGVFFFFNKNFGIYRNFFKVSEYKNAFRFIVQILIREKDSLGNFLELEPIIQVLTVFTADFNLSQASIHLKFLEEKYFVLSIVKILMKEREKCDKLWLNLNARKSNTIILISFTWKNWKRKGTRVSWEDKWNPI